MQLIIDTVCNKIPVLIFELGGLRTLSKIERFFFRYNIELFVIGLAFYVMFGSIFWDVNYNFIFKIICFLLGSFMLIPMLCVAINKSLVGTKCISCFFIFLYTPLILLHAIYEKKGDVVYMLDTVFFIILIDVVVYRSYLHIKFEKELK